MAHPGIAHIYAPSLLAFEHTPSPRCSTSPPPANTLLFLGGLTDGLLTIPYPRAIAASLPSNWSLAEVLITSSYTGWGTGRLSRDASELSQCVSYFRSLRPGGKIVIMGHSTGCQGGMEYLVGPESEKRAPIDGLVMQGGVSDREAWSIFLTSDAEKETYQNIVRTAKEMLDNGRGDEIVPEKDNFVMKQLGTKMDAYRTYSLLAPGGDDDYFSSDLSDQTLKQTFGRIPRTTSVCFLLGSEDPFVPKETNKTELLARWTRFIREGGATVDETNGGVVQGAHHNLDGDSDQVVQDLVHRVCGFLKGLDEHHVENARREEEGIEEEK